MPSNSDSRKCFSPEIESVEEFIQRFKLQNFEVLEEANNDPHMCAMILANSLPTSVLTDIQRRLKPMLLTAATYDLERNLIYRTSSRDLSSVLPSLLCLVNRNLIKVLKRIRKHLMK